MKRRTVLGLLVALCVGMVLGLGAYFALNVGLVWSVLLVAAVVVVVGVVAQTVGILTRGEPK